MSKRQITLTRGKMLRTITGVTLLSGLGMFVNALPASAALGPNLVQNPSMETQTGGFPACFEQAGYGGSTVTYSTVAGHTGAVAEQAAVTNYTAGSRKVLELESTSCAPVVTPGHQYQASVWYHSTSNANITFFSHSAAGWAYWTDLGSVNVSADWSQAVVTTPVIPAGVDQITFGLSVSSNGTLVTDDYALQDTTGSGTTPPPPGTGTLPAPTNLHVSTPAPTNTTIDIGWNAVTGATGYQVNITGGATATQTGTHDHVTGLQPGTAYTFNVSTLDGNGKAGPAASLRLSTTGTSPTPTPSGTTPPPPPGCTGTATQCAKGSWTVLPYGNNVRSVHSVLLSNGKVLMMAGSGNDPMAFAAGTFKSTIWDPASGNFTDVPTPEDLFCSGHVQLPNGNVLIMGGNKAYPDAAGTHGYEGLKSSYIFNVSTNTYQKINDLNTGHWYPSATVLGNGNVLSLGGLDETSGGTVTTELFNNATGAWGGTGQVHQTYSYWGLYPSMILMQDGRLFYDGSHVFGNQGTDNAGADIYDYNANTITAVGGLQDPQERDQSGAVLLPPAQDQKVMVMGGGNVDTNVTANRFTDIINLNAANPVYTAGPLLPQGMKEMGADASMTMTDGSVTPETGTEGKMYVNTVLLPDRTVLESNGGLHNRADAVYEASTYDPKTNSFTSRAVDPVERMYHSEALLLPDGRVLEVGSNPGNGSFDLRMSIYTPAYKYQGGAPTITGADSTTWGYGSTQRITGTGVASAELVRPEAVTHQSDPNQRLIDLPLTTNTDGSYSLAVTSNPNLAPPGWYLLFVQNAAGTPSTSKWIKVGS